MQNDEIEFARNKTGRFSDSNPGQKIDQPMMIITRRFRRDEVESSSCQATRRRQVRTSPNFMQSRSPWIAGKDRNKLAHTREHPAMRTPPGRSTFQHRRVLACRILNGVLMKIRENARIFRQRGETSSERFRGVGGNHLNLRPSARGKRIDRPTFRQIQVPARSFEMPCQSNQINRGGMSITQTRLPPSILGENVNKRQEPAGKTTSQRSAFLSESTKLGNPPNA